MKPFKTNYYLIIAHMILLGFQLYFWNFIIDDAFISFRYAKNLYQHHQLVFNVNEMPVEGYSNFLWIIWLTFGFLMNIEPIFFSKISGMIFSHLIIYVLYKLGLLIGKSKRTSAIITIFYTFLPNIALWSIGGLETSLFSLLLLIAIYFFISDIKRNNNYLIFLSSFFFALASLTRHEGLLLFIASIGFFIGIKIRERSVFKSKSLIKVMIFVSCILFIYGSYFLWRLIYYNSFFPQTFIAKQESITLIVVIEQIVFYLPLIVILSPTFLLILSKTRKIQNITQLDSIKIYLLSLFIMMAFVLLILSSWMPGFRFTIPILPFLLLLIPESLDFFNWLAKRYQEDISPLKYGRSFTITMICLSNLLLLLSFNSYVYRYGVGIAECNITLGKWINANTNQSASLAVWDVGAIPFYANIRTIDIYPKSLQDLHVFNNPEDADYIFTQNITFLILNDEFFAYIKGDGRFTTNYRLIFNAQLFYIENELHVDYIYQVYLHTDYYISNASINELINSSPRFYI